MQIPSALGQYATVEEVETELKNTRKDKDKLGVYVTASNVFKLKNPDKALEYADKAINLSVKLSKTRSLKEFSRNLGADAHSIKGIILMNKDEYKKAESVIEIAIQARQGLKSDGQNADIAGDYRRMGICRENQNRTLDAYKAYKRGLSFANKSRDKKEIAQLYYALGKIQIKQKKYQEAIVNLGKAEQNAKQATAGTPSLARAELGWVM